MTGSTREQTSTSDYWSGTFSPISADPLAVDTSDEAVLLQINLVVANRWGLSWPRIVRSAPVTTTESGTLSKCEVDRRDQIGFVLQFRLCDLLSFEADAAADVIVGLEEEDASLLQAGFELQHG